MWAVAACLWLLRLAQINAADVKLTLEHALSGSAFSKAGTISGTISLSVGLQLSFASRLSNILAALTNCPMQHAAGLSRLSDDA